MTHTNTEAVSDELTNLFGEWLAAHATAEQIDSYNDFCERRIIPALSRRAANSAGRVEVKVLEWEDCTGGDCGWCADTVLGRYWVDEVHGKWLARLITSVNEGEEEIFVIRGVGFEQARDAAQADFNQRILSALTPAVEAEPVAWREAYERLMNWLLRYPKFTLGDLGQLECDLGPFAREPGNSPTVAIPHPSSPVSAEVTVTDEMVEAAKLAVANTGKGTHHSPRIIRAIIEAALAALNGGRENG